MTARKRKALAVRVLLVVQGIESACGDDETAAKWIRKLRKVAAALEEEEPAS